MTSRAREQQDSCWLHPQLSWYCPRYSHMRAFVSPGIPGTLLLALLPQPHNPPTGAEMGSWALRNHI